MPAPIPATATARALGRRVLAASIAACVLAFVFSVAARSQEHGRETTPPAEPGHAAPSAQGEAAGAGHEAQGHAEEGHGDPLSHVAHNPIYVPISIGGLDLHISKAVVMMWIAAGILLILLGLVGASANGAGLVPRGFRNCVESIVVFLRDQVVYPQLGHHNGDKYLPLFLTFFFFILVANLAGMVPGAATATAKVSVTAALASLTLATMILGGMKEQGAGAFWKNLVPHGVPWWLWPLMFVIEIVGLIAKPFALTIRLFANMTAGHIVLAVLLGFTVVAKTFLMGLLIVPASVLGAVAISCLEIFVAFLQAYIFTFLSAVFIGLCLHPEH